VLALQERLRDRDQERGNDEHAEDAEFLRDFQVQIVGRNGAALVRAFAREVIVRLRRRAEAIAEEGSVINSVFKAD
jgi:hypothetical protein